MKIPERQKRYCPHCNKHTEHKVRRQKTGKKRSPLSRGERRFKRITKGYRGFPRPNPKGREKPTRKLDLRYKCMTCGREQIIGKGFRVKKAEFVK